VGWKTDDLHGPPLSAEVLVEGFYEGVFHEKQPRHGVQNMRIIELGLSI